MSTKPWFPVESKTYVVLGLARSGLAAVKWLREKGAFVIAFDDNLSNLHDAKTLGAEITQNPEDIPWSQVAAVVQSPGVPLWLPAPHPVTLEARKRQVPIIGDGDLLRAAHPHGKFVGITGTNGKSTTTALVGHILKECGIDCQVGGNIGIPMLGLPLASTYVLELSSYQLDLSETLDLEVAAWLNITPDHLDRHGTLENYVTAKKRLFQTSRNQIAIIGTDDPFSEAVWQERATHQYAVPVSVHRPLDMGICVQDGWLQDGSKQVMDVTDLPTLKGVHNFQNTAVAYGVCRALGIAEKDIAQAIRTFPGLAHRQELVRTLQGIAFINDSKGTNADATAKALSAFDRIYWIAGGQAKSGGIESLSPYFSKIIHAFLIGEAQDQFAATLEGKVPYTRSGTLDQAVEAAYQRALRDANPQAAILLSPACASYDQFQDFEHRGKVFCELVQALEASSC